MQRILIELTRTRGAKSVRIRGTVVPFSEQPGLSYKLSRAVECDENQWDLGSLGQLLEALASELQGWGEDEPALF